MATEQVLKANHSKAWADALTRTSHLGKPELNILLTRASVTIDELREQNIIIRKILMMINTDHELSPGIDDKICAWCGGWYGEEPDTIHEDTCVVTTIQTLLPTIPEIK